MASEGEADTILFLSPSYVEAKKYGLLVKLFNEKGKSVYIALIELKETEKGLTIPIFAFKCE